MFTVEHELGETVETEEFVTQEQAESRARSLSRYHYQKTGDYALVYVIAGGAKPVGQKVYCRGRVDSVDPEYKAYAAEMDRERTVIKIVHIDGEKLVRA